MKLKRISFFCHARRSAIESTAFKNQAKKHQKQIFTNELKLQKRVNHQTMNTKQTRESTTLWLPTEMQSCKLE